MEPRIHRYCFLWVAHPVLSIFISVPLQQCFDPDHPDICTGFLMFKQLIHVCGYQCLYIILCYLRINSPTATEVCNAETNISPTDSTYHPESTSGFLFYFYF